MVRGMETFSRFWQQFIATAGGIAALIAFIGSDFERGARTQNGPAPGNDAHGPPYILTRRASSGLSI